MKRLIGCLLVFLMISALFPALADAPTSQFGFKGWPYRQSTPCDPGAAPASPAVTAAPAATPAPTPKAGQKTPSSSSRGDYTTTSVSMQEKKLWNLLNEDRARYGLPALPLDSALSGIARTKACDMKENHYFAHTSPTYGSAADMLRTFGYSFRGVGENIAHHATVEKSEAAFMSSTGHRNNILGSQWTKVGIGVCTDSKGFVYVTQLFAR